MLSRRLALGLTAAATLGLCARPSRCFSAAPPAAAAAAPAMPAFPKPPGTARILLTGDVMLGRGVDQILPHHCDPVLYEACVRDARAYVRLATDANGPLPADRPAAYPWGVALNDMQDKAPDARIINLETAVTTNDEPWPSKGINYRMHPGNVATITAAGVDVCALANNHVLDWEEEGLLETLDTLHGAGLLTAGAGRDLAEAEAPAVVPLPPSAAVDPASGAAQPGRLLVWAIGHGSSGVFDSWAAGQRRPGVALADLSPAGVAHVAQLVARHKRPGDIALVSVHWGSNWGFEVPKEHRRFAHALSDEAGVDVVHGHSSHHAKGAEVYKGRLLLYGCGDLISDYEGIMNYEIESHYPPEMYRDDVGVLWYADVSTADGRLRQLTMTPTRLKHLSLHHPEPADWQYISRTLDRECRKLGGSRGVGAVPGSGSLMLQLDEGAEAGGRREE
ncbi:poly-gamma-glutamate biosynthesis [Chlorella sorokiniana]|uniref:Poly-gamma-glutamate biosynthesis n=1 Tax=Chlorella sorokiniana TaxID=3076 RepID=A0A2P6TWV3_CHLSO|nr:poly-gamma-glutamate biosynthesis [Chlorella sorokiniana]|eukprot:PRW58531.1 poly-gamma-glutamate biosynthesis [Chlorella sorokiniana]